ncbi:hypothetical protein MAM1_0004d00525 [Mucor ambiguus]|uniref:Uncharacterized protein n=1 Tax=Mucor ambiguus TaxID=91626 RepID=A0A0C9M4A3_9FUNG|nr:hypothetical protein MAM1_0004d00525 [Mucor ambiguus]
MEPTTAQGLVINTKLMPTVANPSTIIQDIDPGIVTAASGVATAPGSLFKAVNRFHAISNDQIVPRLKDKDCPFSLTANMVNTAVMLDQDRKQREKKDISRKKNDKTVHDQAKGSCTITFTENRPGSRAYIKGNFRRSPSACYKQLAASTNDSVVSVDGYKDGRIRKIPRRLTTGSTTANCDLNGAKNIALIGFSCLLAQDGLPLPAFRRILNSNDYSLSQSLLAHQSYDDVGISTQTGD